MAVVFISPKQRQKMFFIGITVLFLLIMTVTAFGVFLSKPPEVEESSLTFNRPKVSINMRVFDTEQFQMLQDLPEMLIQFSYKATAKDGKIIEDFITAPSVQEAKARLEAQGLVVTQIKETELGRENPFLPYYKIKPPVSKK
jgi:hypothetical protein